MRELLYKDAIREAMDEEMARDERVFLIGEDVGVFGGSFKCSVGLRDKYGDLRCKDAPISESAIVGVGIGSAIVGMRPIVEIMYADFLLVCMDQVCNQAAKINYMSGGQIHVPMVIRTPMGGGRALAAQHSQCLHAWVANCPGLKIALPSTAREAKGLLKTAVRDDNPVLIFEHKAMYNLKFDDLPEPDADELIPFGKARLVTEGDDITVVSCSYMSVKAEAAAHELRKDGVFVELLDLRTITPLDTQAIVSSVKKTGRLLVVDEGHESYGISGEIIARVLPDVFYWLEAPAQRLCTPDIPVPFTPVLEQAMQPNERTIAAKIKEML